MKNTLLTFCVMLMAGFASAQCNPQFTVTQSPSGNNLLRVAVTNTSIVTPSPGRNTYYTVLKGNPTSVFAPGVAPSSVTYITYVAPGTYSVRLAQYIADSVGTVNVFKCTDTLTQNITVAYPSCGTTLNYTSGTNGAVNFVAATPAGTPGMNYSWNYGDGTSGTGMTPTHTYTANGTYTVTLTATSSSNCTYTNTATIVVSNVPFNCAGHNAAFTSSVNNNVVTFTNTTTAPLQAGLHPSYYWSFGDPGGSSNATGTVTHTYTLPGTYSVSLISQWNDSMNSLAPCMDTAYGTVTITNVPQPANHIVGTVIRHDTTLSGLRDVIRVWLIAYDSAANTLRAIDSVSVDSAGAIGNDYYNAYYFSTVAAGSYLLKAARLTGTTGTTGPIPTYHDSSLYWAQAAPITVVAGGTTNFNGLITMRNGLVTSGPGFIGGNVSLGANRGSASGVPGMTILLRDHLSKFVLRSAVTNSNGDFSFPNLPAGLYSVYPEDLNYTTTERGNIAVTGAQNTVQGISFNQDRAKQTIKPRTTSIEAINSKGAAASLYPNPAKGSVTLAWKGFDGKAIDVTILNVTGQLVHAQQVSGTAAGSATINIASLQPGVYTVHLHSTAGDAVEKLVIQR